MAIRNILGALGGMLNRGPDQEDPTLTPEERERRRRLMMANRTPFGQKTATPLQTGGGLDQTVSRMEDAAQEKKLINDARKVAEAREEGARRTSKRRFDESRRDLASDKSRQEQEARMSRQNLTDAQSGARSDIQDRESKDRILEGIMQDRAEVQAQEQENQALIDANRQESEQRRAEGQFGQDVRRHFGTMSRMGADRENKRLGETLRQGMGRSVDRMKDMADQARMERLEGIAQERSADALSQPTGELDLNRIASTEQFAEPELPPEDVKSPYEPSGKGTQDNPYVIEETVVEGDAPDEEEQEEKQGLLGRLGGMVKSNPELFAQIAQLGGGLISGMAQDKAQRRADATTQDRMARANLIGALTGRTPQVAAERADTGGLFSLDTLGKAIKGGGALAQDEIGRREAQEQLEYDRGIAEEETEYQREQDRLDRKESEEKLEQGWANIEQGGLKGATALKNKAAIMKGSVDVVDSFLDNLENYQKLEEGDSISWRRMLGGLATNFGIVGTTYNPEAQQYTDSRALIVAEVARIINGGGANVSAKEQQMAESVVPDIRIPRDTQAYGIQKLKRLREILSLRVNAINEGINPTSSLYDQIVFDEAEGQETETEPTEAQVAMQGKDLTPDERDLLRRAMANPDDTEVQSAVNNNPKLKKAIGRG
jgi:hypothetical protein